MAKTYSQLKAQALQIHDASSQGENTAERIGNMQLDHLAWNKETAEALQNSISSETTRAQGVESALQTSIENETKRSKSAEEALANKVNKEIDDLKEETSSTLSEFSAQQQKKLDDFQDSIDEQFEQQDKNVENKLKETDESLGQLAQEQSELERNLNGNTGDKIAIIGDSISTYSGYIPEGYTAYYPKGAVDSVDKTWWKILCDRLLCSFQNLSDSGSTVTSVRRSLYSRALLVDENVSLIIIPLGVNDTDSESNIGTYDYDKSIEDYNESIFTEAYIKGLKQLMATHPNANIMMVVMSVLPSNMPKRAVAIKTIAEHYGFMFCDIRGIYSGNLHPDVDEGDTGAEMEAIANEMLKHLSSGALRDTKMALNNTFENAKSIYDVNNHVKELDAKYALTPFSDATYNAGGIDNRWYLLEKPLTTGTRYKLIVKSANDTEVSVMLNTKSSKTDAQIVGNFVLSANVPIYVDITPIINANRVGLSGGNVEEGADVKVYLIIDRVDVLEYKTSNLTHDFNVNTSVVNKYVNSDFNRFFKEIYIDGANEAEKFAIRDLRYEQSSGKYIVNFINSSGGIYSKDIEAEYASSITGVFATNRIDHTRIYFVLQNTEKIASSGSADRIIGNNDIDKHILTKSCHDKFTSPQISLYVNSNSDNTSLTFGKKDIFGKYDVNGNLLILPEDFVYKNAEYVIHGAVSLNGDTIVVPDNCILNFSENASIQNGTINLNGCAILSDHPCLFNEIELLGYFKKGLKTKAIWFYDTSYRATETDGVENYSYRKGRDIGRAATLCILHSKESPYVELPTSERLYQYSAICCKTNTTIVGKSSVLWSENREAPAFSSMTYLLQGWSSIDPKTGKVVYAVDGTKITQDQYNTIDGVVDGINIKDLLEDDTESKWGYDNIIIKDIIIGSGNTSLDKRSMPHIDIVDSRMVAIDNVRIAPHLSHGANNGVRFGRKSAMNKYGKVWANKLTHCTLTKLILTAGGTDCIIDGNFFWANGSEANCNIELNNSSSHIIVNNEFVGGSDGAIYVSIGKASGLKIANNYFDGGGYDGLSPNCIKTKDGTYIENSTIIGNNFWHNAKEAIVAVMKGCCISSNIFDDNDKFGEGYDDVIIKEGSECTYFTNNLFCREMYFAQGSESMTQRPATESASYKKGTTITNDSGEEIVKENIVRGKNNYKV